MYLFDSISIEPAVINGEQKPKLVISGFNSIQSVGGGTFDNVARYAYIIRIEISKDDPDDLYNAVMLAISQNRMVYAQEDGDIYLGKIIASSSEHAGGTYIPDSATVTYHDVSSLFSQDVFDYLVDVNSDPDENVYIYRLVTRVFETVEYSQYVVGLNRFAPSSISDFTIMSPVRGIVSDTMCTGSFDQWIVVPPLRPRHRGVIEAHKAHAFTIAAGKNEKLIGAVVSRIDAGAVGTIDAFERQLLGCAGRLRYEERTAGMATAGVTALPATIG